MAWTTGKCVGDKYSLHGNIVGTKGMREVVGARIQQLPSSQIALPSPTWSSMNEEMMAEVEEGGAIVKIYLTLISSWTSAYYRVFFVAI